MSFDMKKVLKVKNRSAGLVVYKIPEHNIRREFRPNEVKQITYEELVWLSYQPGGRNLMQHMLQIQDAQTTKDLNIHVEPEYNMSEADIITMLTTGSLDELLDALDFAPKGVIEIIKHQAVKLPVYDVQKRDAILKATGFDVTAAIANSQPDPEDVVEEPATPARRRVQPEAQAPARRTESKYKIISEE